MILSSEEIDMRKKSDDIIFKSCDLQLNNLLREREFKLIYVFELYNIKLNRNSTLLDKMCSRKKIHE
ncbi:9543_t:CDS:1, partial [Racocetra persica]